MLRLFSSSWNSVLFAFSLKIKSKVFKEILGRGLCVINELVILKNYKVSILVIHQYMNILDQFKLQQKYEETIGKLVHALFALGLFISRTREPLAVLIYTPFIKTQPVPGYNSWAYLMLILSYSVRNWVVFFCLWEYAKYLDAEIACFGSLLELLNQY